MELYELPDALGEALGVRWPEVRWHVSTTDADDFSSPKVRWLAGENAPTHADVLTLVRRTMEGLDPDQAQDVVGVDVYVQPALLTEALAVLQSWRAGRLQDDNRNYYSHPSEAKYLPEQLVSDEVSADDRREALALCGLAGVTEEEHWALVCDDWVGLARMDLAAEVTLHGDGLVAALGAHVTG